MAADDGMITVTFLLPGGSRPREFKCEFQFWVPNDILAKYAPLEAYAFKRSDKGVFFYIDGEVLTVKELSILGKHELVQQVVENGAACAVRLRDTRLWAPYYTTDQVIRTGR